MCPVRPPAPAAGRTRTPRWWTGTRSARSAPPSPARRPRRRRAAAASGQELEVEGRLRARGMLLELVQRVLVAQVPVARRHRALVEDVVDAPEHAVRRRLPFRQPDQRLGGRIRPWRAVPGAA